MHKVHTLRRKGHEDLMPGLLTASADGLLLLLGNHCEQQRVRYTPYWVCKKHAGTLIWAQSQRAVRKQRLLQSQSRTLQFSGSAKHTTSITYISHDSVLSLQLSYYLHFISLIRLTIYTSISKFGIIHLFKKYLLLTKDAFIWLEI